MIKNSTINWCKDLSTKTKALPGNRPKFFSKPLLLLSLSSSPPITTVISNSNSGKQNQLQCLSYDEYSEGFSMDARRDQREGDAYKFYP